MHVQTKISFQQIHPTKDESKDYPFLDVRIYVKGEAASTTLPPRAWPCRSRA